MAFGMKYVTKITFTCTKYSEGNTSYSNQLCNFVFGTDESHLKVTKISATNIGIELLDKTIVNATLTPCSVHSTAYTLADAFVGGRWNSTIASTAPPQPSIVVDFNTPIPARYLSTITFASNVGGSAKTSIAYDIEFTDELGRKGIFSTEFDAAERKTFETGVFGMTLVKKGNKYYYLQAPYALVSNMTSSTTPEGKVTTSYERASEGFGGFKAFNGDDGVGGDKNRWVANTNKKGDWLMYEFAQPVRIKKIDILCCLTATGEGPWDTDSNVKFETSMNGQNFVELGTFIVPANKGNEHQIFELPDNIVTTKFVKMTCVDYLMKNGSNGYGHCRSLQYYGYKLKEV